MKRLFLAIVLAVLALAQTGLKSGIDRSGLDTTCKPCDDFWRYANGTWIDKNPVPAQFSRWGTFPILRDANQERLKVILEAAAVSKAGGDERKIGDFYSACMDTKSIDAAGAKPLEPAFRRIAAIQTRQDLARELAAMEELGEGPIRIGGQTDRSNAKMTIAAVGPGALSLPDSDYFLKQDARSKEIRDEFVKHAARMLELSGMPAASTTAAAQSLLAFETELATARLPIADRRDPNRTYNRMDFAKARELAPSYDWNAAVKLLKIQTNVAFNVSEPAYVQAVERQLTQTPIETWKLWMRWRTLDNRAQYLSKPLFDERFHFRQTVLNGVKEQQPRWKMCAAEVDDDLPDALGKLYVAKHFPPEAKRRMTELVENLRATLREQLQNAAWLQPETRANAVRKLESFDPRIGYPNKWRDYSKVQVNRNAFLAAAESAGIEERRIALARIGHEVDRSIWGMTAPTVNAQYSSTLNAITFPAGILQSPFFTLDADDAANYGAIGAVIGHEMGHGFDDQGSKYDADGNLKNWWTDQDRKNFESRAGCVTSQFDTLDLGGGKHHNGKLVTGEAMGDLSGLTLAYQAYHRSLNGKDAPVIDGFTGDQRLFLAFARVWADHMTPEAEQVRLNTDPHPLPKYRTNATLSNMPEFHQAFACKRGDPMVRPAEQQCRIW